MRRALQVLSPSRQESAGEHGRDAATVGIQPARREGDASLRYRRDHAAGGEPDRRRAV